MGRDDIEVFAQDCVFIRSVYVHLRILFDTSGRDDKERMARTAPVFFGDINAILVEHVILEICKITDPARDIRNNDNQTLAFLLNKYDFSGDAGIKKRLSELTAEIQAFRQKLLPARNKRIAHRDRDAVFEAGALGAASQKEWDTFWLNLQDVVCIMNEQVHGKPFLINDVGGISDADELLRALKFSGCFEQLLNDADGAVARKCIELANR